MPGPLLALAAGTGVRLAGAGLSRIIGGKPKIPDLVQPVINAAQNQVQNLETQQRRNLALAEEQAARAGGNPTAAREDIINASGIQSASLRGSILDGLARARQQQELVETDIKNQQRQQLQQGIQSGFNAAGAGLTSLLAGDPSADIGGGSEIGSSIVTDTSPVQIGQAIPEVAAPLNPQVTADAVNDPVAINAAPTQSINPLQFVPSALKFRQRMFNNINA